MSVSYTHLWSVDDYATFLHELLMHIHLTRVIFIAHSFGARIAPVSYTHLDVYKRQVYG